MVALVTHSLRSQGTPQEPTINDNALHVFGDVEFFDIANENGEEAYQTDDEA